MGLDCFLSPKYKVRGKHKMKRLSLLNYKSLLDSLENYKEHMEESLQLIPMMTPVYSHCEKELTAINELLSKPDILKTYVDTWNNSLQNLYDVKEAVDEYGRTISAFFSLDYIGIL